MLHDLGVYEPELIAIKLRLYYNIVTFHISGRGNRISPVCPSVYQRSHSLTVWGTLSIAIINWRVSSALSLAPITHLYRQKDCELQDATGGAAMLGHFPAKSLDLYLRVMWNIPWKSTRNDVNTSELSGRVQQILIPGGRGNLQPHSRVSLWRTTLHCYRVWNGFL